MLRETSVKRKIVWQEQHKTGKQSYFHCGSSIRVKHEKNNKDVEIFA